MVSPTRKKAFGQGLSMVAILVSMFAMLLIWYPIPVGDLINN